MARLTVLLLFALLVTGVGYATEAGRYVDKSAYLDEAFPAGVPPAGVLWLSGDLREAVERSLGHDYRGLRIRYWQSGKRSAWILDEIGKELPITIGVTVEDGILADVRVLEFRESRGWEVRYPFFTGQFVGARLEAGNRLDRRIDGITGATLSVRAVTRIARIALILHEHVSKPG